MMKRKFHTLLIWLGTVSWFAVGLTGCSGTRDGRVGLDGEWLLKKDSLNVGVAEQWYSESFPRTDWKEVHVPGHWDRYGLESYDGVGWYATTITVDDVKEPMVLFFGGVDDDADIWVNGTQVGGHTGYSEAFYVDVSGALRRGRNEIVVRVRDNAGPGGIYKPVTLIPKRNVGNLLRSKYADEPARPSAPWVKNAIIYEVYLRSFSPEGTFRGLEQRIPELKRLGATVLWLMPINPVGEANRKGRLGSSYSVQDYYGINPEYGTLEDFKSLVNTVHANGMKIIIDLVANHTAWDSKLMFEHSDWFTTDSDGAIVSPNADWTDVADLNYDRHELRKYMIAMMEYWVRDVGIDGYRCDVAELVPTDFWETARRQLDKIKPVMMLSEGTMPEHHVEAFDITYSWNVYDVLGKVIDGTAPATIVARLLQNESYQFPRGSLRLRFNSNHDKNYWDAPAVVKYGPEGAKATALLTMTLPGVPLIYNGEEVGNDRRLDLFDKTPIDWTKHPDFREFYTDICSARMRHRALRDGRFAPLGNSDSLKVVSFERRDSSDRVVTVINLSKEKQNVETAFPSDAPATWVDVLTGERVALDGRVLKSALPAFGYQVLIPTE